MTTPFFSPEALAALRVPSVGGRWAAVQQRLHPVLAALAEQVGRAAAERFPRQWPLYETSFKSQRYVNRGRERAPIDEYHVAFDRPPRGAGVLVSVSGAERAVLVGLQLWGSRKQELQRVWENGRQVWQPLVERIEAEGQARFAERAQPANTAQNAKLHPQYSSWIDRYLANRAANYLWVGFVYPWDSVPDDLEQRLTEQVLDLLPLNDTLMEEAEALEYGTALIREVGTSYAGGSMPPIETIVERIRGQGFALSDKLIRSYHVALQTKPLVISAGH